eukprot:750582-Lingulodinium_polyedra.AAC.1
MKRTTVQFASRYDGARSIRPHHCVAFCKRCATMRLNRPSVAKTALHSHARALHARARKLAPAWIERA